MKRNVSLKVASLTLILIAGTAAAAVLLNPPRRWFPEDLQRNVIVDNRGMASVTDGDNGISAARSAVTAWNGSGANVVSSSTGAPNIALGDGQSHLLFDDPLRICKGQCLAATTTGFYDNGQEGTCDGLNVVRITDSDIVFNTRYNYTTASEPGGCSGEFFLESVVTHEVGHLIGLAHSQVGSALMAPSVSSCNNKMINADDRAGRDALYNCSFQGGGGNGGSCDNDGVCESGENCTNCGDCEGRTNGKPANRFCCGDGTAQGPEGNGSICDGNF